MKPPSQTPPDPAPSGGLAAGQTVGGGRYVLKQPLGAGGMGVVWLAHDTRLREPVALKFPPPQISFDPAAIDHLRRETLRSRRLSHPNIVRIHDLHEAPGEPVFISMEYVDGPNLHDLRARRPLRVLTWKFLAPLVRQLCQALDYAHAEGILHRDLKPANLMLDANGRLKLADFGLACVMSDSLAQTAGHAGGGTLHYMSPQQADGQRPDVADDIYSLGATLYELLTSKPPFHAGDIAHQVQHTRPDPLAQRLLDLGLTNEIPSEVSALLLSCLAKDPEQRPRSARAILEWLDPIEPPRSSVTASAPPPAPAPIPAVVPGRISPVAKEAPPSPSHEATAPPEGADPASTRTSIPDPAHRRARTLAVVVTLVVLGAGLGAWVLWKQKAPIQSASGSSPATGVVEVVAPPTAAPTILRQAGTNPPPAAAPARITGITTSLDFSPDGRTVASAGEDGSVRLWGRNDGRVGPVFNGHQGMVNAVAFSPVDNGLAASAGVDGSVRLWGVTDSARHRTFNGHRGPVNAVVFTRDGARLWSAGADGTLKIWDVSSGMFSRSLNDHNAPVLTLASSPAGQMVASGDLNGSIRLWNPAGPTPDGVLTGHTRAVTSLAISPDGRSLASASSEKRIYIWDLAMRRLRRAYAVGAEVQSLAWVHDGMVLFGGDDGGLHSLDLATGRLNRPVAGPRRPMRALARSADGVIAMGTIGGQVTYWNPKSQFNPGSPGPAPAVPSVQTLDRTSPVRFPPGGMRDGYEVLFNGRDLTGWDGDLTQWKAAGGCLNGRYEAHASGFLTNRALFYRGPALQDFELKFAFRVEVGTGEVLYRAAQQRHFEAFGYAYGVWQQGLAAAIELYPSGSRTLSDSLGHRSIRLTDDRWHSARIVAQGNRIRHELDGDIVRDAQDSQNKLSSGMLALQLRGLSAIQFSNICLKRLPADAARR